jgi:dihydrodipicolinate synthase/N-acetylneuraminate lyase
MMRRRRGPGLLRTAGRTAVIAGTATAVSGKVAQAQHAKQEDAAAAAAPPPQAPPAEPQQAKPTTSEQLDQLERLAALHQQGVLDDAELAAAKARILANL